MGHLRPCWGRILDPEVCGSEVPFVGSPCRRRCHSQGSRLSPSPVSADLFCVRLQWSVVNACVAFGGKTLVLAACAILLAHALGCGRRRWYCFVRCWGDLSKATVGFHPPDGVIILMTLLTIYSACTIYNHQESCARRRPRGLKPWRQFVPFTLLLVYRRQSHSICSLFHRTHITISITQRRRRICFGVTQSPSSPVS